MKKMSKFVDRHSVTENIEGSKNKDVIERAFGGKTSKENDEGKFTLSEIPLDKIIPRSLNRYSQTRIDRLAESIKNTNNRLIHPIIVVRPEDLPEDSAVLKGFTDKKISLEGKEFIIVSGERRYSAFIKLREEYKKEHSKEIGTTNPFDTITANILTRAEAKNEENYYNDSNLLARQLNPIEIILHIKDALAKVSTPEEIALALKEMGKDPGKDPFVQSEYVAFYLENELGIDDYGEASIKRYSSVVNNCDPFVIDKIMSGEYSARAARELTKIDKEDQKALVKLYVSGDMEEYDRQLALLKPHKASKGETSQRYMHIDAKDNLKAFKKKLDKEIGAFEEIVGKMAGDDKKSAGKVLERMLTLQKEMLKAIEDFEK